jgi:hypothetical protein
VLGVLFDIKKTEKLCKIRCHATPIGISPPNNGWLTIMLSVVKTKWCTITGNGERQYAAEIENVWDESRSIQGHFGDIANVWRKMSRQQIRLSLNILNCFVNLT